MMSFRQLIRMRVLVLVICLAILAWLLVIDAFRYALLLVPVLLLCLTVISRSQIRTYRELEEFAEAVKYRDFTRHYPAGNGSKEAAILRQTFNDINAAFRKISSERETQHHYLQHILQVVQTAIVVYQQDTGRVMWINEAFKELFGIPFLHLFDGLKKRNADAYEKTVDLKPGEPVMLSLTVPKGDIKVQASSATFTTAEGSFKLIAYLNISDSVDLTESRAWQKLLSVLTHEIMNSIAPISSLADTLKERLSGLPDPEQLDDVRLGAETIKRRSEGLLQFAGIYRSLNEISQPDKKNVYVADLFENLFTLMEPTLLQKNITLDVILKDPSIHIHLDRSLIEQVLINLLLNAIEAVKGSSDPYISLSALSMSDGKKAIGVSDNGAGIPTGMIDNIFVPFFTTRKNGSGIGLTLSKQIMLLHGGSIRVQSVQQRGSTFTLLFPAEAP